MQANIAFFDSGQGGLTVWEKVLQLYPNLNTIYLGDNARCPYGNKSPECIIEYTRQAAQFLSKKNIKFLSIVCGTASSVATDIIKNEFNFPVIGIVEGLCKFAAEILTDKSRTVAVLATHYTIQSGKFTKELQKQGINNVWPKACPLFVPLVESGISEGPMVDMAAHLYLSDIPDDVKVVMLGCTHYPRIIKALSQYLFNKTKKPIILKTHSGDLLLATANADISSNDPIYLIEASLPVTKGIKDFIDKASNISLFDGEKPRLYCTDAPRHFEQVAQNFTHLNLPTPELVNVVNVK